MSKFKQFIENLNRQNSDYTSPESAQNLANSLESLSTDIYTDSQRFIYELLQNADDASSSSGSLEFFINIIGQNLVISHNGDSFTEIDIESLCSVGDGNKKGDENKTGFKGIGFKSVFSYSDFVIINSENYCFRFEKEYWKTYWLNNWGNKDEWEQERSRKGKQVDLKMPWQIIPIWTDLPVELHFLRKFKVSTIIRHSNTENLQKELFGLFSNTQILLFLRSKHIKITISKEVGFSIEKITTNGLVILRKNSQKISEWLLKTFRINVDGEIKLLMENDVRIPQKLKQANKTEISLAVQIENDNLNAPDRDNRLIFTYLPTSINYDFSFLVNASFLTDAGRQHLHEDLPWNIWLFGKIPIMLLTWLAELAQSKYRSQILKLVPHKLSGNSRLKLFFDLNLDSAIQQIAFIPSSNDNKLLKVSEAILDRTKISDLVGKQILADYITSVENRQFTNAAFIPRLEPLRTLKQLGIKIFDLEDLESFLKSTYFQDSHSEDHNFSLILFLYEHLESNLSVQEKEEWIHRLKSIPFIFDQFNILKTPQQVYFPAVEFSNDFDKSKISVIHLKVMSQLESNPRIKNWLEKLGVKEPTDIAFIEKTIILDENYITVDNAIKVGRYLFSAHKKGILTESLYDGLKKINLLSTMDTLCQSQNAYLPEFYEPEFPLDKFLKGKIFVNTQYPYKGDLKSEWRRFFLKIGVNETIKVQKFIDTKGSKIIESEYFDFVYEEARHNDYRYNSYPSLFHRDNPVEFDSIVLLKFAKSYKFSKIFWEQAFKFIDLDSIQNHAILEWGYFGRSSSCNVTNYIHWALINLPIIPTTHQQCYKSQDVFINHQEILEIGGRYLPIFDHDGSIPQKWLQYFSFKSFLDLDDYLRILSLISQDQDQSKDLFKENQERISMIYKKLADNYLTYAKKLKAWGRTSKILAKNRQFCPPSQLSIIMVEGFKRQNLAFCDEKSENVVSLLKIFGVSIIDTVQAHILGEIEQSDLKAKVKEVLPLIAIVSVERSSKKSWETEYRRLSNKLNDTVFFEADKIHLSYGDLEDTQLRRSWFQNNCFYYVGNWKKLRVLDGIVETLGKFLGVRGAERHLSILLSDSLEEGIFYIKEKFGNTILEVIPEDLLKPSEVNDIVGNVLNSEKNVVLESSGQYDDDGTSNQEKAEEYRRLGEDWAKRFYKSFGYEVKLSNDVTYDLLCSKGEQSLKVEVKAITFDRHNIRISQNKWQKMTSNKEYEIFIFSHYKGHLKQLVRIKEAWLLFKSELANLHNQSNSTFKYGSNEIDVLIGLQMNQDQLGNDILINWHRLIRSVNHDLIEKYQYNESKSRFETM